MSNASVSSTPSAPALMQRLRGAGPGLEAWWASRSGRERNLVAVAAALVALAAIVLAVQPAATRLREVPRQREAVQQQTQQMQRQAAEAQALRAMPPVNATQAQAALKAASERLGSGAKLLVQGDRITLNVTGVSASALQGWLQEVRSAARARPLEVRLTRSTGGDGAGGGFDGLIILGLSSGGPP